MRLRAFHNAVCFEAGREGAVRLRDRPKHTVLGALSKSSKTHFALRPEGKRQLPLLDPPKRSLLRACSKPSKKNLLS